MMKGVLNVGKVVLLMLIAFFIYGLVDRFSGWFDFEREISPSSNNTLLSIQQMGELTALQVRIEKVVEAETSSGFADFLFGDELLLVAAGDARLGIDLNEIDDGDIRMTESDSGERSVQILLPPVEVLQVTLDEDSTYVFDRITGFLRFGQDQTLEGDARRAAVDSINEHVTISEQYNELAEDSVRNVLSNLLTGLEFDEIELIFEEREVVEQENI